MKIKLLALSFFIIQFSYAQKTPTADEIINKYLLLSGNLKKVSAFSYQLSSGGQNGNSVKYKAPSKLYIAYVYEVEEVVRIYSNGKTQGEYYPITKKSRDLSQDKFWREVLSNNIFPELLIETMGIKIIFEGIENVSNQKAYKIKFEAPNASSWFEYFEINSGLKMRTTLELKNDDGEMIKTTLDYQGYNDLGAFHLPKVITITMSGFDIQYLIKNFRPEETLDDSIFEGVR